MIKPINFGPTVKQSPTKFYKKLTKSSIIFTVATCDQERVDSAHPKLIRGQTFEPFFMKLNLIRYYEENCTRMY